MSDNKWEESRLEKEKMILDRSGFCNIMDVIDDIWKRLEALEK